LPPPARPQPGELAAREVEALWADLAGDDAGKAWQGIQKLAESPAKVVPLFRERLRPEAVVEAKKLLQWISDLDSEDFSARQKATDELEKLGELAVPALNKLLADPPSLESRRRAEQLLEKVRAQTLSADQLRLVRAVEVLERVGGAEVRRVLEGLAKGAEGALPTREARAALYRLSAKP
jgi:hypothetical protein